MSLSFFNNAYFENASDNVGILVFGDVLQYRKFSIAPHNQSSAMCFPEFSWQAVF